MIKPHRHLCSMFDCPLLHPLIWTGIILDSVNGSVKLFLALSARDSTILWARKLEIWHWRWRAECTRKLRNLVHFLALGACSKQLPVAYWACTTVVHLSILKWHSLIVNLRESEISQVFESGRTYMAIEAIEGLGASLEIHQTQNLEGDGDQPECIGEVEKGRGDRYDDISPSIVV